jgi:hypothetical protein
MVSRRVTRQNGKKDRTCFATLQSAIERDDSLLRAKILAKTARHEGTCGTSSTHPVTGLYSIIYGNPFLLFKQAEG